MGDSLTNLNPGNTLRIPRDRITRKGSSLAEEVDRSGDGTVAHHHPCVDGVTLVVGGLLRLPVKTADIDAIRRGVGRMRGSEESEYSEKTCGKEDLETLREEGVD